MKRREFLQGAVATTAGIVGFPMIVPSTAVSGQVKPNDRINIGQIGFGRIARSHDLPETLKHDVCRAVAVADVDIKRARDGKAWFERYYAKKVGKVDIKVYQDYREMLQDKSIDAVIISTPDHWHAQPAIEAALAGKDIYIQKPCSLTIAEGRKMSDIVRRTGRILQIGSQQRSLNPWPQFKWVCELVRNGKIGEVKHVKVGLGTDPGCGEESKMPVPENLDYDMWHTVQWGLGTEDTGPVEIEGQAEFPKSGLWNVHGKFDVHAKYAGGITMHISSSFPNGVRFEGSEGWIFVSRGNAKVTASDPVADNPNNSALKVSDPKILRAKSGPNDIKLYESPEQHQNWLDCIRSRRQPVAPVEVGHRSCSVCLLSHIAMKLPRKLYWDPKRERFINDKEANKMLSRSQRRPYGTDYIKV